MNVSHDSDEYFLRPFTENQLNFLHDSNSNIQLWDGTPESLAQRYGQYFRVHVRATELFQTDYAQVERLLERDARLAASPSNPTNVKWFGAGHNVDADALHGCLEQWHSAIMQKHTTIEEHYNANVLVLKAMMMMSEYMLRKLRPREKDIFDRRVAQLERDAIWAEAPHRMTEDSEDPFDIPPRAPRFKSAVKVGDVYATPNPSKSEKATQSTNSAHPITRGEAESLASDFSLFQKRFVLPSQSFSVDELDDSNDDDDKPDTRRVATFDHDRDEYGVVFPKLSSQPLVYDRDALISMMLESKLL